MNIAVDTHTHTIFSGHAYGTAEENARHAAEAGLQGLAITDHFWYGFNGEERINPTYGAIMDPRAFPKTIHGVRLYAGVEIDIVDNAGNLAFHDVKLDFLRGGSLCDMAVKTRDIVIASLHNLQGEVDETAKNVAEVYCRVAQNPDVDVIGHPERVRCDFELDPVLQAAKDTHTLVELNTHSMEFSDEAVEKSRRLALRCAQLAVPVVVSSDAHSPFSVGQCAPMLALLEEIGFPEELIVNRSVEALDAWLGLASPSARA